MKVFALKTVADDFILLATRGQGRVAPDFGEDETVAKKATDKVLECGSLRIDLKRILAPGNKRA